MTGICEDFEGNLWVSTYNYGAYCLKNSKFTSFTEMEGLQAKIIYSIVEDQDGALIIDVIDATNLERNLNITLQLL